MLIFDLYVKFICYILRNFYVTYSNMTMSQKFESTTPIQITPDTKLFEFLDYLNEVQNFIAFVSQIFTIILVLYALFLIKICKVKTLYQMSNAMRIYFIINFYHSCSTLPHTSYLLFNWYPGFLYLLRINFI